MRILKVETSLLIISFVVTVILGMIIIPILKKLKVGQIERTEGPKSHLKTRNTNNGWNYNDSYNDFSCNRSIYLFCNK